MSDKSAPEAKSNGECEPYYAEEHRKAVAEQRINYIDPRTGYTVLTALFLSRRGYCCESGCRHCPYGFKRTDK